MLMLYDEHVNFKIATGLKKISQVLVAKLEGIGDSKLIK